VARFLPIRQLQGFRSSICRSATWPVVDRSSRLVLTAMVGLAHGRRSDKSIWGVIQVRGGEEMTKKKTNEQQDG
jgi:hypothetical protein